MFCPILEFGEENRTFAKVKGGNVDFFTLGKNQTTAELAQQAMLTWLAQTLIVPWAKIWLRNMVTKNGIGFIHLQRTEENCFFK